MSFWKRVWKAPWRDDGERMTKLEYFELLYYRSRDRILYGKNYRRLTKLRSKCTQSVREYE